MSNTDGTCEYVLDPNDPETWGNVRDEVLNEEGVWTCPHDAEEDLCIFHQPVEEKDDEEVIDAFLDTIDGATNSDDSEIQEQKLQFLGARFNTFDLSENPPELRAEEGSLDFSYAKVGGPLNWSSSMFNVAHLIFTGTEFQDHTNFRGAKFRGDADFGDVGFGGDTDFNQAEFGGDADFRGVEFCEDADFNQAEFGGDAFFGTSLEGEFGGDLPIIEGITGRAEFDGRATFQRAEFSGDADFRMVLFDRTADFGYADFGRYANFNGAEFGGDADFNGAEFGRNADFRQTEFRGDVAYFGVAEFGGDTYFNRAEFGGKTNFTEAEFRKNVDFEQAEFGEGTDFEQAEFDEDANFRDLNLDEVQFGSADLTDTTFIRASLRKANFETTLLSRATLFGADLRRAKLSGAVLGDVRIDEDTIFLGHTSDDSESSPHTLSAIRSRPTCVYDPDYEEENEHADVDKAKSVYRALEEIGGKHARPRLQARSFVRRQDLQKQDYWDDATADDASLEERFIAGARWSRAKIARATLLYGESPWRVIAWSLGIILSFALLYPLGGWVKPTDGDPITYAQIASNPVEILNSVYYSTLTYTALGFGDFQPVGLGRLLTTLETGLGAVMLALLVFILGRRAAR